MPSSAASVRTLVVSWNDAADRNESVASDALVMPRMISSYCACSLPFALDSIVDPPRIVAVDELAREVVRVALLLDADLLHHLTHDHLDVLVVDVDALGLVDLLDLLDEVQLRRGCAPDLEHSCG